MKIIKWSYRLLLAVCLLLCTTSTPSVQAWEWSDYMGPATTMMSSSSSSSSVDTSLTMTQVSEMRVRDLKRRLIRRHGYGADEVGRMLDKKDLIQTLAFEEHKVRQKELEDVKRHLFWKGIFAAVVVGALTLFWPLLQHLYEVASVNLVVYTDRKWYEAKRCWDYQSIEGCLGVILMGILDVLQLWMTVSILLGWFMSSKYFFPIPSLPIRPAALMGGPVSQGPLSKYGLNVAPMAISWGMRFVHGRMEIWVGNAMRRSFKRQKKQKRDNETDEERAARKAVKRAAKAAEKAKQEEHLNKEAPIRPLTTEEMRQAASEAAEARRANLESNTPLDDLD